MLYMYAIILIILMIIELAGFIAALIYKSQLKEVYTDSLQTVFNDGLMNNKTQFLEAFHKLEESMKCCGVHNISDYAAFPKMEPSAWCKKHPDVEGCADTIIKTLNKQLPVIGGTLGAVIILELFGLIGAIALARASKNSPGEKYDTNIGRTLGAAVSRRR